jgi:hypothetical protein
MTGANTRECLFARGLPADCAGGADGSGPEGDGEDRPALDGDVLELDLPAGPVARGRVVEIS